jgi:hypothetical protein
MKSAWSPDLYDLAAGNAAQVEGIDIFDFEEMLAEDIECREWDELDVGWPGGDDNLDQVDP